MLPLALFSIVFCLALGLDLLSEDNGEMSLEQKMKNAMADHGYTVGRADLLDNLAMLEAPSIEALGDRFRIPILFERAQLGGNDETVLALPEDLSDVRFPAGLDYARARDRDLIRELVSALAACGAAEGGRPVRLRVEGYASSEPFERAERDVSLRLNVHLANERRRVVESELRAEVRRLGVEAAIELAEVEDYTGISEMERYRRFNDRPGDSPARGNYEQDLFTRAAHIRILDLSGCSYRGR